MEPIAIIGFALRLPENISDEGSFWEILKERRNLMAEWPASRIAVQGLGAVSDFN
jgi:acyl transferase domain-containing protein